jgi:hypothetical protein
VLLDAACAPTCRIFRRWINETEEVNSSTGPFGRCPFTFCTNSQERLLFEDRPSPVLAGKVGFSGAVAQLVEHLLCKKAAGSAVPKAVFAADVQAAFAQLGAVIFGLELIKEGLQPGCRRYECAAPLQP